MCMRSLIENYKVWPKCFKSVPSAPVFNAPYRFSMCDVYSLESSAFLVFAACCYEKPASFCISSFNIVL